MKNLLSHRNAPLVIAGVLAIAFLGLYTFGLAELPHALAGSAVAIGFGLNTQAYATANAATYNQYYVVQELIEHAEPIMAVSKFGKTKPLPQNKTDTILFSRVLPIGYDSSTGGINVTPTSYQLSEGSTPTPTTIQYQDVQASLQKYGVLYRTTEKTELMNERNIPEDMRATAAEGVGSIKEMIVWNQIKGGTNVVYANGAARTSVNTAIGLNSIDKAIRQLRAAHAKTITEMVRAGPDYGSQALPPAYVLAGHTDAESDYRKVPGFKAVEDYGSFKPVHDAEIGTVRRARVVLTPMLKPWLAGGSATLNGMVSAGGSNVDVYPSVLFAQGAYGHVPLKGRDAMTPFVIPASQRNHANPSAQFGYVGVDFYTTCVRLNEFFMTRIEHAVTSL
jgi:N4-gp56 family major capsid protein